MSLGDVAEQHPELFETVAIAGVMLIIPESWFLRPLFMVFGMSPEGPVEGALFLSRLFTHRSYACLCTFTARAPMCAHATIALIHDTPSFPTRLQVSSFLLIICSSHALLLFCFAFN